MKYIEAPIYDDNWSKHPAIFLAGGITDVPDWQSGAALYFHSYDLTIFNPRRASFDVNSIGDANRQITWEHYYLERSDVIMFWFAADAVQPISLLELGIHAIGRKRRCVVGVDPAYPRRLDVTKQLSLAGLPAPYSSLSDTLRGTLFHATGTTI